MQFRRASSGQLVSVSAAALLGEGGEARIFGVEGDTGLAAKLYHRPTSEHAAKLAAMLANPPQDPMLALGHVSIAWPVDLLTGIKDTQVLGFLMPRVTGMSPVIDLYHPKTRRRKHPLFSYQYLLRTARNLSTCVSALHERGYVVGDLNESNLLVGQSALVAMVDTDSFQVPDRAAGRVYRCRVGKPEFTPPELQTVKFAWVDRKPEHDLFGLAVLLFQLLMEGTHPFAGRHFGRGEPPNLEERIGAGLFPYAQNEGRTKPMPGAPPFDMLPVRIRELFTQTFVAGHGDPACRPDALTWSVALSEAETSLITCAVNEQHRFGVHLTSCPWCERQRRFKGLDPFPSRLAVQHRQHVRKLKPTPRRAAVSTLDFQAAARIAREDMEQQRWELSAAMVMMLLTALGLIVFWWWVIVNGSRP